MFVGTRCVLFLYYVYHALPRPHVLCTPCLNAVWPLEPLSGPFYTCLGKQVLMYTAMKSIFEDKNNQEDLFFKGPGKDLDVRRFAGSLAAVFFRLKCQIYRWRKCLGVSPVAYVSSADVAL